MNPYLYDRRPYDEPEAHWSERALCAQVDPVAFFPEKGCASNAVKDTCKRCEVRTQCLAEALALSPEEDRHGIRGGLSERERRVLRRTAA